jgi:hypothetical protein
MTDEEKKEKKKISAKKWRDKNKEYIKNKNKEYNSKAWRVGVDSRDLVTQTVTK